MKISWRGYAISLSLVISLITINLQITALQSDVLRLCYVRHSVDAAYCTVIMSQAINQLRSIPEQLFHELNFSHSVSYSLLTRCGVRFMDHPILPDPINLIGYVNSNSNKISQICKFSVQVSDNFLPVAARFKGNCSEPVLRDAVLVRFTVGKKLLLVYGTGANSVISGDRLAEILTRKIALTSAQSREEF